MATFNDFKDQFDKEIDPGCGLVCFGSHVSSFFFNLSNLNFNLNLPFSF